MIHSKERALLRGILLWYRHHARVLPWRATHNPYRILVSEVMLQQTQVPRVVPTYKEFLKRFPDVRTLAEAKTATVIRAWKGLGYNRRALFLQKTAQQIIKKHHGRFPKHFEELKALPGIGDYTARAIMSFAYDVLVPVLDTNHRKFYQRTFFGKKQKTDKELLRQAEEVVSYISAMKKRRGTSESPVYEWNQALMDFMSAVGDRECSDALIAQYRRTYATFPIKRKKTKQIPFRQTDRYFRGQTIDVLRAQPSVSITALQKIFPELSQERLRRIVLGLERDGLILIKKGSILLP